jgi:hypothetical protein
MGSMAIKTTRDASKDFTIHTVTGSAGREEMHGALEEFYRQGPTSLVLWDMSESDVAHVTPAILKGFVERSVTLGVTRENGRTAVLAPTDLQFGLGRMSQAMAELSSASFEFQIFRSKEHAMEWLLADD